MNVLSFIAKIFLYFFTSLLTIYGSFLDSMVNDTGIAVDKLANNFALQLGSTGLVMPIVLVISVAIIVFAFSGMLMVTSLINSFLE